jgi:P-type E1-E2 ATPase
MGGANNICSDKTGTLTKNEMNVTKMWSGVSKNVNHNAPSIDIAQYF